MNIDLNTPVRKLTFALVMLSTLALLAGCERSGQGVDTAGTYAPVGEQKGPEKPLGEVMEYNGFTLRANASRADVLSEDMARQYGIDINPDLALLNLVIQDNRSDLTSATVEAEVSVEYQNLLGQSQMVEMRAVEVDGYISYVGTLDASSERIFQLAIKAKPADTELLLEMNFELRLDW